jgi:hypothetical protein
MLCGCAGTAVLVERGNCSFYDKYTAIVAANGSAMLLYNNEPGGYVGLVKGMKMAAFPLRLDSRHGRQQEGVGYERVMIYAWLLC